MYIHFTGDKQVSPRYSRCLDRCTHLFLCSTKSSLAYSIPMDSLIRPAKTYSLPFWYINAQSRCRYPHFNACKTALPTSPGFACHVPEGGQLVYCVCGARERRTSPRPTAGMEAPVLSSNCVWTDMIDPRRLTIIL